MAIVCFDTHFVIWGIKKEAEQGQEVNVSKASHTIELLAKEDAKIIIPSYVIAEILAGTSLGKREELANLMGKRFLVPSFDIKSAHIFADMWGSWLSKRKDDKNKPVREHLKVDCLIAAVAIANKAERIYTNDDYLKKYAEDYIRVITIEDISLPPQQLDLL